MKKKIKFYVFNHLTDEQKVDLFNTWELDRGAGECEMLFDLHNPEDWSTLSEQEDVFVIKKLQENYRYCLSGMNYFLPIGVSNINNLIRSNFDDICECIIKNPNWYKIDLDELANKDIYRVQIHYSGCYVQEVLANAETDAYSLAVKKAERLPNDEFLEEISIQEEEWYAYINNE